MTDSEPNREPKMDSSAPRRDAGQIRAWDEGTPAGESGPRPSRTDVDPGAGRAPSDLAAQAVRLLAAVDLSEDYSWDRRKTILDIYYEGYRADYVAEDDEFYKRYAGLIAVASWASRETIETAQIELGDPMNWSAS